MGYRSDVRIITSKKGFDKLKSYVTDTIAKSKNPQMYNLMENLDLNFENSYSKFFGWNNVKWYYEDVDIVMQGLHKLKDEDMSYRFARLGENFDDYEEEYYESEKEEEQDFEYPAVERYFDDDYVMDNMKTYDISNKDNNDLDMSS